MADEFAAIQRDERQAALIERTMNRWDLHTKFTGGLSRS